ncbi:hypothetical protein Ddye_011155 [Dipteronia dyeriana]|uniref:Reverse transcriptase n=1 Tax=Dipteronia dyeriana TaxID=168575 RepID=A0AAD9XFJ0_9ROSI|nr:hypothetical protein Ddye_011155 [Dipteronia dyeriana]
MKASVKKARHKVRGLMGEDGLLKESKREMEAVIVTYFTQLFSSSEPSQDFLNGVLNGVRPKLSAQTRKSLDAKFTAKEIRHEVFDMGSLKAPGNNELTALFYKNLLGESLERMNGTLVTLTLKIHKVKRITDFGPISLCNMLYKIIAKAITNTFRTAIGEVISESQSAFIPGCISDNIIVGFECMHRLKRKKEKEKNG